MERRTYICLLERCLPRSSPDGGQSALPAQAGKAGPCRLLLRSPSPAQPVFRGPALRRPRRPPARHSSRCAATPRSRPQPRRWNRSRGDEGRRSRRGARWASAAAGTPGGAERTLKIPFQSLLTSMFYDKSDVFICLFACF
uniref:Uncharacterized protein n=1 Tax=Mustela putorius furo TaxID=9669 RepID=M3YSR7_MUSPF